MRRLQVVLILVVALKLQMLGQDYKAEVFGGYSLERIAPGCGTDYTCGSSTNIGATTDLNGWIVSATGYLPKSLGLTAQFTANYNGRVAPSFESVHRYSYQFGPVYRLRWQHASAFAHALFGGITQQASFSDLRYTKYIWSVGGGLDVKLSSHLSVRVGQIDYERQPVPITYGTTSQNSTYAANGLRYSAGIVARF